jgi:hypothetical protein
MLAGDVERGGDLRVGAFRGERQMAGSLLDVRDRFGQCPVNGAPPRERRLLVADGREQRVGETHARVVQHYESLSFGLLERL